ncbi:transcriptional regulator, RpiR family [Marinobacterium lutimaris]|uniref:Transcriptional regulator, RpiR family n=1 Tax=Marinobacterium lutimaris TaxID=568106 RepID=A0A1H5V554_9GAMM|nr:transcriptional regulator, RpiR family [Marinobacterium lutimaris]
MTGQRFVFAWTLPVFAGFFFRTGRVSIFDSYKLRRHRNQIVVPDATIDQKLQEQYDQLTPSERLLADFILAHPQDLALFNTAELARMCHVSKATVSRLFKRLGFSSFREGRTLARQLRHQGVPVADDQGGSVAFDEHLRQEEQNLHRMFQSLDQEQVGSLVDALESARRVRVIGFRNSYPVALHLRQQLIQVRSNIQLLPLPGQTLGEELADLAADDLVILFGFRRRPKGFDLLLSDLCEGPASLVLIGDESLAPAASKADWWFEAPVDSRSAFDSYASAMCLITLLVNSLLHRSLETGRERIARISHKYADLNELSLSSPKMD